MLPSTLSFTSVPSIFHKNGSFLLARMKVLSPSMHLLPVDSTGGAASSTYASAVAFNISMRIGTHSFVLVAPFAVPKVTNIPVLLN